jgi:hypothetical protein
LGGWWVLNWLVVGFSACTVVSILWSLAMAILGGS